MRYTNRLFFDGKFLRPRAWKSVGLYSIVHVFCNNRNKSLADESSAQINEAIRSVLKYPNLSFQKKNSAYGSAEIN